MIGQYDLFDLGDNGWDWVIHLDRDQRSAVTLRPMFRIKRIKTREEAQAEMTKLAKTLGIDAQPGFTKGKGVAR